MATPSGPELVEDPALGPRPWLRLLLVLIGLAWLVAVPLLTLVAIGQSLTFLGERLTAAQLDATQRFLWVATAVALGLAVAGVVTATRARSRAGAVVFVLLLLLSSALGVFTAGRAALRHADEPTPPGASSTLTPHCQELSGGGTRCPGG